MARTIDSEKRKKILDAAFTCFGETGFNTTTIKEVAEAAGVAAGTVYTYFENKDDLFDAVVEENWNTFLDEVHSIIPKEQTYETKIQRLLDYGFTLLKEAYPLLRGMFAESTRRDIFQAKIDDLCQSIETLVQTHNRNNIPLGKFDNFYYRTFALRIVVSGIMFTLSITPPEELDETIYKLKRGVALRFLDVALEDM